MGRPSLELTGNIYTRLTVIASGPRKGRERGWTCLCECGKDINVASSKLVNGHTKSCGCYRVDFHKARLTTHGHTSNRNGVSKTYKSWSDMHHRCGHHPDYVNRGISVCERWSSFANFLTDMGERPTTHKLTLDRIDNDGNYEPGNCRWTTYSVQNANQRVRRARNERHGNSVLPDETVIAIRSDPRTHREIGAAYGVSYRTVGHIKQGKTYYYVE